MQTTAQERFGEAVGAKQVLFSTNGSSLSVHPVYVDPHYDDRAQAGPG